MTSDQHTDHIATVQQVIRNSSLPAVFYFFSHATLLKTILANRISGTFGFARHTSRPFAKPKEPFFAYARITTLSDIKLTLPTEF